MRETPRSQETAGDAGPVHPTPRSGRALAHTTGVFGSGSPHRSDGRPPHTPRGARRPGHSGGPGTTPLVPGLPFLGYALFLVFGAAALLFSTVTWQVAADGPLRTVDERLGRSVVRHGAVPSGFSTSSVAEAIAEFCADLGSIVIVVPVLVVAMGYGAWCGHRARARLWWLPPLAAAVVMGAVPALVAPLKAWLQRPGPDGTPFTSGNGYYPSGHAATAAVGYGAVFLLAVFARTVARASAPRGAPANASAKSPTRTADSCRPVMWRWLLAGLMCLNLAIGLGLVRRGYHWPLDVLGSWCLSALLLGCVVWSVRRALTVSRPPQGPAQDSPPHASPTPAPPTR
ncbi:phosphatase PAP2 family protein [Streptomyces zagrosensis]|uniref:Undecaprenyl-diphosphatase n=1 Tax=Streptomyces zagrosensis TaxID=1042984 RepID=A0A7W9Q9D5_9ACTN|nr:phosphatase PAP2 family protein [Streptomyces zagrosensis]MBB5936035.1 undecaprenyl-diphosphatase [Streptomyces zagrosensis]